MYASSWSKELLLLLLIWISLCLAKGGGGGGGGAGGSGSSGSGGSSSNGRWRSSGDNDEESSLSSEDSTGSSTSGLCTDCGCIDLRLRNLIYSLPASYYNGTLNIIHKVTQNSARTPGDSGKGCLATDSEEKSYSYPGLLTITSNLNSTDKNGVFWNVRGFPLQGQNDPFENSGTVMYDWIRILSANVDTDLFEYTDADGHGTETYWDTKVDKVGLGSWNANATYSKQAAERRFSLGGGATSSASKILTSNYITLSDVCAQLQEIYMTDLQKGPASLIPSNNTDTDRSLPAIFFDTGATASITGIGTPSLNFSMKGSVDRQVVSVNQEAHSLPCNSGFSGEAYYQRLQPMQNSDATLSATENFWNISAEVSIQFSGALVRKNSTKIVDLDAASPVWDIQSKAKQGPIRGTDSAAGSTGSSTPVSIAAARWAASSTRALLFFSTIASFLTVT